MSEPDYPPYAFVRRVSDTGSIGYRGKLIQIGARWRGAKVQVIDKGRLTHIYPGEALIRALRLDPNRRYQPKPRKDPPTQRSVR